MAKTEVTTIAVKDLNMEDIQSIITKGENAAIEDRIAAYYVLEEIIGGLKSLNTELKNGIEHTSLPDITSDLEKRGVLRAGSTPVIVVGERLSIKLSEKLESNFDVDTKKLDELGTLIPEKYKKVTVAYDKKVFEEAYKDGTLEAILKPYVSEHPETVTKMTKSTIKSKDKEEA